MNLKQTLSALILGFAFGIVLVWLLAIIIPMLLGYDSMKFILECSDDIYSMSIFSGGISCVVNLLIASNNHRRRKREELEDEMREYFRKQNEKED